MKDVMSRLFTKGSVVCDLKSKNKFEAIHELIFRAPVLKNINNLQLFETIVCKREKELSTGLGHGVAFAHGKTDIVDNLYVALGISREGIDYESVDGKPVHLLFVVANPPSNCADYLKLLSALSRVVRHSEFTEKILAMKENEQIEAAFREALTGQNLCTGNTEIQPQKTV